MVKKLTYHSLLQSCIVFLFSVQLYAQIDKAKAKSDADILDPNKAAKVTVWISRGDIYSDVARKIENYDTDQEAVFIAYDAYQKALQIDNNKAEAKNGLDFLYPIIINYGAEAYQKKNLTHATKIFRLAHQYHPLDTLPLMYASMTAFQSQDYSTYELLTEELLEMEFNEKTEFYISYASYWLHEGGSSDKGIEVIEKGLKHDPYNLELIEFKINTDIRMGNLDRAVQDIKNKITEEPSNVLNYYDLGVVYEINAKQLFEKSQDTSITAEEAKVFFDDSKSYFDNAILVYNQGLSVDSNHAVTLFNAASIHYNEGVYWSKKFYKIDYKLRKSKDGKVLEETMKACFVRARPYFEKLYSMPPQGFFVEKDKLTVMECLKVIYASLQNKEDISIRKLNLENLLGVYRSEAYVSEEKEEKILEVEKELESLPIKK